MKVHVRVHRDATKTELIDIVELNDIGMVGAEGITPNSDEGLIRLARLQIVGQDKDKATEQEAGRFHYEVTRP